MQPNYLDSLSALYTIDYSKESDQHQSEAKVEKHEHLFQTGIARLEERYSRIFGMKFG
jgi:hypothetical protein